MNETRPDILNRILARKQQEIDERRRQLDEADLRQRATAVSPPRGFVAALQRRVGAGAATKPRGGETAVARWRSSASSS